MGCYYGHLIERHSFGSSRLQLSGAAGAQGLHKLSPMFPHDPAVTFNDFKSPGNVLEYDALAETLAASAPDDDSTSEFTCATVGSH